jgi:hypothetical protein
MENGLFEQGFNDATAWLIPRWGNEWITEYIEGWYSGAAFQMEQHPPYCGIQDRY